jgi:Icc-related predicted phosphoesterase
MKMLVCGDFHGSFPIKFNKIIKKENVELVISLGDYPPFHYRKLWFKHCYGKDVELWEVIGKRKYKKLIFDDLKHGENSLKYLNKLEVPVFTVLGNMDYPDPNDVADTDKKRVKSMPNWDRADNFSNLLKKYSNIKRFDYKALKFGEYVFIGMRGHSYPGRPKSKGFRKHAKILDALFKKFKKENKARKLIFVSHIVPYNTKLDKIGKHAPKIARGKHYGSKLTRRIIEKHKPILALGGHIHECVGKIKMGKTTVINPGAIHEGKASIVNLENGRIKNIKFIR